MASGVLATTITSPFDVLKTRVQTSGRYEGVLRTLVTTARAEGVGGLFKGWVPNYLRLGPQTVLVFLIYENLRKLVGVGAI